MTREERIIRLLETLEKIMSALDDATTALAAAVAANTTAINNLIAAHGSGAPTDAQLAAIAAQTTAVEANTTAIDNVLNPPTPAPLPPPAA